MIHSNAAKNWCVFVLWGDGDVGMQMWVYHVVCQDGYQSTSLFSQLLNNIIILQSSQSSPLPTPNITNIPITPLPPTSPPHLYHQQIEHAKEHHAADNLSVITMCFSDEPPRKRVSLFPRSLSDKALETLQVALQG